MRRSTPKAALIVTGLSAFLMPISIAPAFAAFGAFAHDQATGRYGYSWNEDTEKKADEAALKGCASDKCKIVFRTRSGQCGALATSGNGKIWGGATRPKKDEAEKAAVENCSKRVDSGQCKLRGSECTK